MERNSFIDQLFDQSALLKDLFLSSDNDEKGVDVIIPVKNTNPLWERNLHNFYEHIPIRRLIIGNAGCTDGSIDIVRTYPRVIVLDHTNLTLGYSLAKMIELVESEWFIYLHADIFLPDGWYEDMVAKQGMFDWFECKQRLTVMLEYEPYDYSKVKRPFSGSQMGRKESFKNILPLIDNDYLYRNEDIVFAELIQDSGFRYGVNLDTFHYHQLMNKRGELEPKFKGIRIEREPDNQWEIETNIKQVKGIIKYLSPDKDYIVAAMQTALDNLYRRGGVARQELEQWVLKTDPSWMKYVKIQSNIKNRLIRKAKNIAKKIKEHYYGE